MRLEFGRRSAPCDPMARMGLGRLVRLLPTALGIVVMAVLLAWLMGAFAQRVPAGETTAAPRRVGDLPVVTAALQRAPATETAVGTIRAVRETVVSSRILGRVRRLAIERAGQAVRKDDVIAELEAADLAAAVESARAAVTAALTRRDKAKIDCDRTRELAQQGIASPDKLESDTAALRSAEALLEQSQQALAGAETALSFATVTAPIDGVVVDKKVNQGDVVQPGQPICVLYDPARLQLVAVVREELAGVLATGQQVDVSIDALGKQCRGTVAEIVPEADARSRSFAVKVVGPCQPGIVTGMFGRLHVPLGERELLLVPTVAVQSIGQLDLLWVVTAGGELQRRLVRRGAVNGDQVEILAGLQPGERIVADARRV